MFRINKNLCAFSPCGRYFACALQQELIIRNSKTLENIQSFNFIDTIELMDWSPSGKYILCASINKAAIQIFSLIYPQWKCKLTEGSAGLERIIWADDSQTLLITSDLNIHVSIWTINEQNIIHIWNLKSSALNIALNKFRKKLAVIVTMDGTDSVEIYKTDNWKLSRKLICDKLFAIDGISWSENGELLAIWCATIGKSRILVYSTATDAHIGVFSGDNNINNHYCMEKSIQGIQKVAWNPTGQLLAVAGYNETVAIVNHATWSTILQLCLKPVIKEDNYLSRVFTEPDHSNKKNRTNSSTSPLQHNHRYLLDEVNERPVNITIDLKQRNYEICVSVIDILEFSPCGKFLAIKHQLYPSTLWIWDLMDDSVDYILLKNSISGIAWQQTESRLLILSESPFIVEWQYGERVSYIKCPQGMKVRNAKWHPNSEIVALYGYNKTSIISLKN